MAVISCERAWELLSRQLDEPLSPEEERELEEHLAACPSCRKEQEELAQMKEALQDLEEVPAPADFTQRVMEQVGAESQEKPKVIPLRRRPQVRALVGLAACALLCIGIYRVLPQGSHVSDSMVTASQGAVSAQQPEGTEGSSGQEETTSSPETDQNQTGENTPQSPAAQPRAADLAPDVPDQSSGQTQQATPYTRGDSGSAQAQEGQSKAQTPQVTTASTQTVLVLHALPTGASALLPALNEWDVDSEGNVSCTVTSQVLEQLCRLLDQEGADYTVTSTPWSVSCIVRLG